MRLLRAGTSDLTLSDMVIIRTCISDVAPLPRTSFDISVYPLYLFDRPCFFYSYYVCFDFFSWSYEYVSLDPGSASSRAVRGPYARCFGARRSLLLTRLVDETIANPTCAPLVLCFSS